MAAKDTENKVINILQTDKSGQEKAEALKKVRDFYLRAPGFDNPSHKITGNEFFFDDFVPLKNAGITVKDLLGAGYALQSLQNDMNGAYVTSLTESKYYGVSEFKKANVPATAMQQAGFGALFLLDKNRNGEIFTNKNVYKADQGNNRYHQEEVAGAGYDSRDLTQAGVNMLNKAIYSPPSSPQGGDQYSQSFVIWNPIMAVKGPNLEDNYAALVDASMCNEY